MKKEEGDKIVDSTNYHQLLYDYENVKILIVEVLHNDVLKDKLFKKKK